ncbi:hypothetical protein IAR50_000891 [Cryptococcus sp. DSM 104548]
MYTSTLLALLPLSALAPGLEASPIRRQAMKREVPQEHSHEQFLTTVRASLATDNPQNIQDPVFGLLGNAAAAAGQGDVTNTDCLQQATADQAFTNAKAAGDVAGMTAALMYRALERNTGQVGLASVACNETATNPEIAAISQHQDPASDGAADTNKAITLALAQQIAAVGGDPLDSLKSGTFAAGDTADTTAAGNTCDDADDADGCIFTQDLLQEDATEDEISSAVAGVSAANAAVTAPSTATATSVSASSVSASAAAGVSSTSSAAAAATLATTNAAAAGIDVGDCTDFSMTFAAGLDGRAATEFSFEPTDLTSFNHGTALNPSIITQFMCDTFVNACAQSASTRDACKTVAADLDSQVAAGTLAKDQTFADAWLTELESAFGLTSTGTGSGTGAASNATAATAAANTAAAAAASTSVSTTSLAAAASGDNLQTFTGALNGIAATPITNIGGDRPFQVKTDTFVNAGAAFQRSCDQQFNGCANAANSGSGDSTVSDCSAQQTQCNAAATA